MTHNWPNYQCPLDSVLVNPPAECGTLDGFVELLFPGAPMSGIDLQGCFPHGQSPRHAVVSSASSGRCLGGVLIPAVRIGAANRLERFLRGSGPQSGPREVTDLQSVWTSLAI